MNDNDTNKYEYLGGTDRMRVETFGMFSAQGTEEVADIIENALDGASARELIIMMDATATRHGEIYDTEVRNQMIYSLPAGSLVQHTMCEAFGTDFQGWNEPGVSGDSATLMRITRARTEKMSA